MKSLMVLGLAVMLSGCGSFNQDFKEIYAILDDILRGVSDASPCAAERGHDPD